MLRKFRTTSLCLICFLALTGCGFFGEEYSDAAAAKRAAPPVASVVPSVAAPNYLALNAGQWLNLSRSLYQERKYVESIGAAETAILLKPDYAEAFNNIGAAYAALRLWDLAIQADLQAVRLAPGMQLARNNLAWAISQKAAEKR